MGLIHSICMNEINLSMLNKKKKEKVHISQNLAFVLKNVVSLVFTQRLRDTTFLAFVAG